MTNLEQALQHYRSPYETYRLRRFQPYLSDNNYNIPKFDPSYDQNAKIGVAVCTYGALPIIDLQLYYLTKVNNIQDVVIIDDCSPQKNDLINLAKYYNVDFISTTTHLPYIKNVGSNGDTAGILFSLQWAAKKNLDVVVKLSRRLVPCYKWIDNFKQLVLDSNALTFSSYCVGDKFNFRTECFGMNVKAWNEPYIINLMKKNIDNNYIIFAEYWFHELAKLLSFNNISEKWLSFDKKQNLGYFRSGYALWLDLLGDNRYNQHLRHDDVLWHIYNTPQQYLDKINSIYPNKYSLKHFDL